MYGHQENFTTFSPLYFGDIAERRLLLAAEPFAIMCAYLISTDLYGGGMFPCAVNLSILAVFQHVYSADQNVLSGNLLKFNGKLAETLMVCKIHIF